MASSSRQAHSTPPNGVNSLTTRLRFEFLDEDERALLGAYAIASSIGVAFLLLVQFGPRIGPRIPEVIPVPSLPTVIFTGLAGRADPSPIVTQDRSGVTGGNQVVQRGAVTRAVESIGLAFRDGAASLVGQRTNILGAVAVTRGAAVNAVEGGKAVLEYGDGGVGSVPTRGGIAGGGASAIGRSIGGVGGNAGVARSAAHVAIPAAIPIDPLTPAADAATVGTFVRGQEAQLRFCYEESGLRVNPVLAGLVTVAITVGPTGSVASASVAKRSWSGPGAAEAESCILRAVRGWRFPASGAAAATYTFPFNFSR